MTEKTNEGYGNKDSKTYSRGNVILYCTIALVVGIILCLIVSLNINANNKYILVWKSDAYTRKGYVYPKVGNSESSTLDLCILKSDELTRYAPEGTVYGCQPQRDNDCKRAEGEVVRYINCKGIVWSDGSGDL